MTAIVSPLPQFFDLDGSPLSSGYLYFGTANGNPETSPATVYWDAALTQPAAQPLRTSAGAIMRGGTAANVYAGSFYSLTVRNASGQRVLYSATSEGYESVAALTLSLATAGTSTGAGQVGYLPAGTGAVATTVQTKLRESVSIKDFLPIGFNTANDATVYAQAALSSGALAVDFLRLPIKHDAVTVPPGVSALNVSSTKYTNSAGNIFLVNTGSMVTGKIAGTGLVGAIQRCIYPAADGVTDVALLLEVSAATVGVHAQYITTDTDAHRPKRWTGYVYAHDIVGTAGNSEGYGVLLSPADACQLTVNAKTIARHALYLSAGAQDNAIDLTVDGCLNYAAQLYSTSSQGATQRNRVTINYRNPGENVAGQGGAVAIVQKAHYNTVTINIEGNGACSFAGLVEGASGGPYPLANKLTGGSITGQFIGGDVIRLLNADSTVVTGNRIDAYATYAVIASRRTGTNGITHGGYIYDNQINAQAAAILGIYAEVTTVPTFIGLNDIRGNGAALRVDDSTGGKRQGFSRRVTFSGTTASINATTSGDTTATLPDGIQTVGRAAFAELSGASVQFFDKPFWTSVTGAPSETQATFRTYNGHSAAQTFNYYGAVEGD